MRSLAGQGVGEEWESHSRCGRSPPRPWRSHVFKSFEQITNQPGDLRELPRVRDQAGGGHADVGVDVGDPSVGASLVQLGGDNLFTCKDHSVLMTMILVNV